LARTDNRLVAPYNPGRTRRSKRTCPNADSLPFRTNFRYLPDKCKREILAAKLPFNGDNPSPTNEPILQPRGILR
ncbi:hypothetical protein NPIL_156021, partial [Nephila pilipes]